MKSFFARRFSVAALQQYLYLFVYVVTDFIRKEHNNYLMAKLGATFEFVERFCN
jgi:hypothetical protein